MTHPEQLSGLDSETSSIMERFITAENDDIKNMCCATFAEYMLRLNSNDPEIERRLVEDVLELDDVAKNIMTNTNLIEETANYSPELANESDVVIIMWAFDLMYRGRLHNFPFHASHFMIPEKASLGLRILQRARLSGKTEHLPADAAIKSFLEESRSIILTDTFAEPENEEIIFQYRIKKGK